jgi:tripartite-type tricarboxylate transporter receptor subunit TctC
MQPSRRRLLQLTASSIAFPSICRVAGAQAAWPSRPVRIVIGYPPGGTSDIVARMIGQWLSERLGQPFIIENRTGAGTNIATEAVVNSAPDGHTLLYVTTANAMNTTLYDKLTFNFIRDIVPVASLVRIPLVMVVHPSFPAKTVPEFIAYAKSNPGKVTMASAGIGGPQHIAGELFKMLTSVDMLHVPYRGSGPALTDLITDRVNVMFDTLPTSLEFIKTEKLRPLAVTTIDRVDVLPHVPPVSDVLPGFEASAWTGIGAPKGTPADIVNRLNAEINEALASPKIRSALAGLSFAVFTGTPAQFGAHIAIETEKWGKGVKFSGVKAE